MGYIYYYGYSYNKNTNLCYYEICGDYPEAYYDSEICYCYDYDLMGEVRLAKTKIIN